MNMIVHESPFIDSIYHLSYDQYPIKDDFFFRGSPSLHECIVLNPDCAVVTFTIDDQVSIHTTNIVCGKFTRPPKINIFFKDHQKRVTIIRLNLGGILKLTNIPIASMVNRIFPAFVVSSYLSETTRQENSLAWIEIMMKK